MQWNLPVVCAVVLVAGVLMFVIYFVSAIEADGKH
jgi:hypothetical protein